jgi:hypothetical protein
VTQGIDGKEWMLQESPLLDGLHRNHGLFVQTINGAEEIYIAADEGVFVLTHPKPGKDWKVERVLAEPTSDLWLFDLDGDGEQEMLTIQPFHGNLARLYKRSGHDWQPVWEMAGEFGHVVWAGRLRGSSCLLLGWRGGEKNLDLYVLQDGKKWQFSRRVIEAGGAPLNVGVLHGAKSDLLLASLASQGEVVLFELS